MCNTNGLNDRSVLVRAICKDFYWFLSTALTFLSISLTMLLEKLYYYYYYYRSCVCQLVLLRNLMMMMMMMSDENVQQCSDKLLEIQKRRDLILFKQN